ncbi:MAG: hypothetical protein ACOYXT_29820 [Bacteroidota bacterium]
MIVAAIILLVMIIPVLWIVFVPVNLKVNTARDLYEVRQTGTVAISLHPEIIPFVRMRILGFSIDMKGVGKQKKPGKKIDKKQRRKKVKSLGAWINLIKGVAKSFHCKRFICDIDFDDVVLNAQLFPIGYFASRGPVMLNINFERKNRLDIWIQARMHRMLWTFIKFYLTK